MAIHKRHSNEAENEAIINKVAKVLNNTDYPTRKTIVIESAFDEVTTIRYNITELIMPETDFETGMKGEGTD